jgi:hypothetical protein
MSIGGEAEIWIELDVRDFFSTRLHMILIKDRCHRSYREVLIRQWSIMHLHVSANRLAPS